MRILPVSIHTSFTATATRACGCPYVLISVGWGRLLSFVTGRTSGPALGIFMHISRLAMGWGLFPLMAEPETSQTNVSLISVSVPMSSSLVVLLGELFTRITLWGGKIETMCDCCLTETYKQIITKCDCAAPLKVKAHGNFKERGRHTVTFHFVVLHSHILCLFRDGRSLCVYNN